MNVSNGPIRVGMGVASDTPTLLTGVGLSGFAVGVWVKNHSDGEILVGDSGVKQEQGFLLERGEKHFFPLTNTTGLYVLGVPHGEEPVFNHAFSWSGL